jgi:hypothetical protein
MDRSIYDYRSKGVYTVAGKKTVLDIKNLKLYHCPPKDESTRNNPATIPTSKKVKPSGSSTHGKLKRLKTSALALRRTNSKLPEMQRRLQSNEASRNGYRVFENAR